MFTDAPLTSVAKENILTIAQLEQEVLRARTTFDRLSIRITQLFGSIRFLAVQFAAIVLWVLLNAGVAHVPAFDPYPFGLLSVLIGLEAMILSVFVLMSQGQQTRQADQLAHLTLQICLLVERETTKVLQMQQSVCEFIGMTKMKEDREVKELSQPTAVVTLVEELDRALEVSETLAEEIEKVEETEQELVEELGKTRAIEEKLVEDLEREQKQAPKPGPVP